jgi:hypothetical protein
MMPALLARGRVSFIQRLRGNFCTLVVFGAGFTAAICVVRTRNLNGSVAQMEAELAGPVAGFRSVPPDPHRSDEIWVNGQYKRYRCFRVGPTGLAEITPAGVPFGTPAGNEGPR